MIIDWLEEWFKGVLIDGIIGNLSGLFDTVNTKVGEIAADVGATPQGWNSGIFNMIRNLSESVIIPIAGAILAFVMTYELIQMVTEKNNLHDIDTIMFFKWVFKTYAAVLIVTNTWNIVMGVFDAAQQVVNQSAGVIIGNNAFIRLLLSSRHDAIGLLPDDDCCLVYDFWRAKKRRQRYGNTSSGGGFH